MLKLLIEENDVDNILKRKLKKVDITDLLSTLSELQEMVEIMKQHDGIGLTANQVNIDKSMFIQYMGGKIEFVINPQILKMSAKKGIMEEGCLSYPNKYISVNRAREIMVRYHNGSKVVVKTLYNMEARIFQHEYDHCMGQCIVGK